MCKLTKLEKLPTIPLLMNPRLSEIKQLLEMGGSQNEILEYKHPLTKLGKVSRMLGHNGSYTTQTLNPVIFCKMLTQTLYLFNT